MIVMKARRIVVQPSVFECIRVMPVSGAILISALLVSISVVIEERNMLSGSGIIMASGVAVLLINYYSYARIRVISGRLNGQCFFCGYTLDASSRLKCPECGNTPPDQEDLKKEGIQFPLSKSLSLVQSHASDFSRRTRLTAIGLLAIGVGAVVIAIIRYLV